jgi:hypothetical protein
MSEWGQVCSWLMFVNEVSQRQSRRSDLGTKPFICKDDVIVHVMKYRRPHIKDGRFFHCGHIQALEVRCRVSSLNLLAIINGRVIV